jgi:hypothetical protein
MTPRVTLVAVVFAAACGVAPRPADAQSSIQGFAAVMTAVLPDLSDAEGRQAVGEVRTRIFADARQSFGEHVQLRAAGFIDGLIGTCWPSAQPGCGGRDGRGRAAVARPTDLYLEWRGAHADVRAGASRVVWGRLDEFQPGDVVNPLDLSRFLLEGRSEARLASAMIRGRVFLPRGWTVEGVAVPWFKRVQFDLVGEDDSPFNLAPRLPPCSGGPNVCPTVTTHASSPGIGRDGWQGGGRVTGTVGRVDIGGSVYRGFEAFPIYGVFQAPTFAPGPPVLVVNSYHPRFTMIAGDAETVRGPWGVRGEVAYFPNSTLQSLGQGTTTGVPGNTLVAGVGGDRRTGSYRIAANMVVTRRRLDMDVLIRALVPPFDSDVASTDVLLVGWAERSFARETRTVRLLVANNPAEGSVFLRAIGSWSLRDGVALEASGGWLSGDGQDLLSRLDRRDFVYARLKVHF